MEIKEVKQKTELGMEIASTPLINALMELKELRLRKIIAEKNIKQKEAECARLCEEKQQFVVSLATTVAEYQKTEEKTKIFFKKKNAGRSKPYENRNTK
jgi:hypothetical protein